MDRIYGCADNFHDVETVKSDLCVGQIILDPPDKSRPHVAAYIGDYLIITRTTTDHSLKTSTGLAICE